MGKVSSPGSWIGDLFPIKMTGRQMQVWRNIWWRVAVMQNISPRDNRFDYERDFGMGQIEFVLNHKALNMGHKTRDGNGQHIMFIFPERWLSTQEEQIFVNRLYTHPQIKEKKLTVIDLVTKSPLIIVNFIKEDIRIITLE